ncbi:hypothetical protein LMH87_005059 [Akanthomyces muscarius]|uniref:Uncharacterized protein n=1 Tax=Akanthomyces muscarius TaxID=2231603 RepID=A0A9W8QNE4_AKAMU|nr:hypothetical protein LMH87_005059 [Akanthomyces muscarius]KAJ4163322.1 hypothetical protein LMH87_005059 [Akanthomyces muscarius]
MLLFYLEFLHSLENSLSSALPGTQAESPKFTDTFSLLRHSMNPQGSIQGAPRFGEDGRKLIGVSVGNGAGGFFLLALPHTERLAVFPPTGRLKQNWIHPFSFRFYFFDAAPLLYWCSPRPPLFVLAQHPLTHY